MKQTRISSNTLFHFTNEFKNFQSILLNGFYPRYCREDYSMIIPNDSPLAPYTAWKIPMVCFCDIPLYQIKIPMGTYGAYCIGLSKEWGKRNKISPMWYAHPNSHISISIRKLKEIESPIDIEFLIYSIRSYLKPYEGKIWIEDEGKWSETIRFYDEREWRFVPDKDVLKEKGLPTLLICGISYDGDDNNKLEQHCRLKFTLNDIRYIIVKNTQERSTLINALKEKKYSSGDIKKVRKKIYTTKEIEEVISEKKGISIPLEQIKEDFCDLD